MTGRTDFLFLPGITGDPDFWRPVGDLLPMPGERTYVGYPGLGTQAPSPDVDSAAGLLARAEARLTGRCVVVAQSMGGALALQLAHRHPARVTHLVLVANSGGVDVARHGATDWRADFLATYPDTPAWALAPGPDLGPLLGRLRMPVLLVWGDRDDISPVAVGRFLAEEIPRATMHVVEGGDHWLARQFPERVAALVERFVLTGGA